MVAAEVQILQHRQLPNDSVRKQTPTTAPQCFDGFAGAPPPAQQHHSIAEGGHSDAAPHQVQKHGPQCKVHAQRYSNSTVLLI